MNLKVMEQISHLMNAKAQQQPTPMEFELAYQARVAVDRIRFAIRHTEPFAPHTEHMQEVDVQLLDALERLESAERHFQLRFRDRDKRNNGGVLQQSTFEKTTRESGSHPVTDPAHVFSQNQREG